MSSAFIRKQPKFCERLVLTAAYVSPARVVRGMPLPCAMVRRRKSESPPNSGGKDMARENKLRDAAMRVGSAVGRVDAKAHKAARKAVKAAHVARQELVTLTKQVDALKRQLMQSTKRLKTALR